MVELADKIYINRESGQVVPEGYPNSVCYARKKDVHVAKLTINKKDFDKAVFQTEMEDTEYKDWLAYAADAVSFVQSFCEGQIGVKFEYTLGDVANFLCSIKDVEIQEGGAE